MRIINHAYSYMQHMIRYVVFCGNYFVNYTTKKRRVYEYKGKSPY